MFPGNILHRDFGIKVMKPVSSTVRNRKIKSSIPIVITLPERKLRV